VVIVCQIRARFAAAPPAPELRQGGIAECFRELALALVAVVEVDERGPGAAVAHPRHKLPEGRARCGGQEVPAVAKIMEMHPGQAGLAQRRHPHPAVEIAVMQRRASRAGEEQPFVSRR
jgi:hypothetical protein